MRKTFFTILISLLTLQGVFPQSKKADLLNAKIETSKSDTITIQLLNPKSDRTGFDWQKNMPWVAAIIIGALTVLTNILISRQSHKTNRESLNQQLKSSSETTDKQLSNAKDIALSQIDNSRRIVQLDFNKTVLSGNRQAWINTLRDAISDYIAKSNSYRIKLDQVKSIGKEEAQTTDNSDLTEILRLETKIVLMLNSNEEDSQLLIKRLRQYTTALFDDAVITQPSEFYQQEVIDVTKTILKERVGAGKKRRINKSLKVGVPLLTNISSNPTATSTNGDTLIWNIPNLNPYQEGYITILDSISATAPLGAMANADSWIEPIAGDTTPQDNYKRCHEIIRGSCDPNDKSVSNDSIIANSTEFLEYIIRFQNTGTDTAFSVLITDTLSTNLNISTIELVSSSHSSNFWVEHGIAKWYFANILLPDSNVNEAQSHGFVKFKIKPISNLGAGIQIPNSANIYFDYNTAVITNTILVNVTPLAVKSINLNEDFKSFPNPVRQTIHLKNSTGKPLGKIELINQDGKLIETKIISTPYFDWQVEHLSNGIYLFIGENWKEKILKY